MNPLQRALVEKMGHDHGFEHVLISDPSGVVLASARHATRAQVVAPSGGGYLLYLETDSPTLMSEMQRTLVYRSEAGGIVADSEEGLALLLRRAAGFAQALSSKSIQDNEISVAKHLAQLPQDVRDTEVERLVRQRVGQQKLREAMLNYWGGACAVTGLALPAVLRASHAKPWSECVSDAERLDVFNGFLLVANLDALFDRFLISFDDRGSLLMSSQLGEADLTCLGLTAGMRLRWLSDGHQGYLAWHRARFEDHVVEV